MLLGYRRHRGRISFVYEIYRQPFATAVYNISGQQLLRGVRHTLFVKRYSVPTREDAVLSWTKFIRIRTRDDSPFPSWGLYNDLDRRPLPA